MKKFDVWYMKPYFFRDGILGAKTAEALDLSKTHVFLKTIEAEDMEAAYAQMQGEVWSPFGEARDLILGKGLQHTSMSMGDVLVDEDGYAHSVAMFGFTPLGISHRSDALCTGEG